MINSYSICFDCKTSTIKSFFINSQSKKEDNEFKCKFYDIKKDGVLSLTSEKIKEIQEEYLSDLGKFQKFILEKTPSIEPSIYQENISLFKKKILTPSVTQARFAYLFYGEVKFNFSKLIYMLEKIDFKKQNSSNKVIEVVLSILEDIDKCTEGLSSRLKISIKNLSSISSDINSKITVTKETLVRNYISNFLAERKLIKPHTEIGNIHDTNVLWDIVSGILHLEKENDKLGYTTSSILTRGDARRFKEMIEETLTSGDIFYALLSEYTCLFENLLLSNNISLSNNEHISAEKLNIELMQNISINIVDDLNNMLKSDQLSLYDFFEETDDGYTLNNFAIIIAKFIHENLRSSNLQPHVGFNEYQIFSSGELKIISLSNVYFYSAEGDIKKDLTASDIKDIDPEMITPISAFKQIIYQSFIQTKNADSIIDIVSLDSIFSFLSNLSTNEQIKISNTISNLLSNYVIKDDNELLSIINKKLIQNKITSSNHLWLRGTEFYSKIVVSLINIKPEEINTIIPSKDYAIRWLTSDALKTIYTNVEINNSFKTYLNESINFYTYHFKKLLDADANINLTNEKGFTFLMYLAYNNHADFLKKILTSEHKAAINFKAITPSSGKTAAFMAASQGHVKCLQLLLEADPSVINMQENKTGLTILMASVIKGNLACVKYIIEKHPNVLTNLKDNNGLTALDLASINKHQECYTYLKSHLTE